MLLLLLYPSPPVKFSWVFGSHDCRPKCLHAKLSFQASRLITTCVGFVHKARTVMCVGIMFRKGNGGDEVLEALTLCKYDRRTDDLFVLC